MRKNFAIAAVSAGMLAAGALPVLAQSGAASLDASQQITCVGQTIGSREQSIDTAFSAYTQAMNAAYSTRAAALAAAYRHSDTKVVATAVKDAWKTFNASTKTARTQWRASRDTAWKSFRTKAKTCRAPGSILDTTSAGSEAAGN